jgi:hypothetical protein
LPQARVLDWSGRLIAHPFTVNRATRLLFSLAVIILLEATTAQAQDSKANTNHKIDKPLRASLRRGEKIQHLALTLKPGGPWLMRSALQARVWGTGIVLRETK